MGAGTSRAGQQAPRLGQSLRNLRAKQGLPLWKVAHAAAMDSTLLSKIELGQRLPTPEQTVLLARFFQIAETDLESMRMAEKFFCENSHNPAAAAMAAVWIHESAGEYFAKTETATRVRL